MSELRKLKITVSMDFISQVTEHGNCPNAAAVLLDYKNNHYPDLDPMEEFTLDW